MADRSIADLHPAEVLQLKAQYLLASEMLDRAEADARARLQEISDSRRQLQQASALIDGRLSAILMVPKPPVAKDIPVESSTRLARSGAPTKARSAVARG